MLCRYLLIVYQAPFMQRVVGGGTVQERHYKLEMSVNVLTRSLGCNIV
jgi:hypothetical protein